MASSPKTMKAIAIEKTGGTEVLEYRDFSITEPKDGEVLIRNEYIGINTMDTYFRSGHYLVPQFPFIPGREAAGTIVSLGPGNTYGLEVGARVVHSGMGSYAEYSTAPASHVYALPEHISTKSAAAGIGQGLTAWTCIRDAYEVKPEDWILVQGAAGGVGLWLCQLIKAIGGRVIGTASSATKLQQAERAGAEVVLDTSELSESRMDEMTGGQGISAIIDGVGKATFDKDLEVIRPSGSVIVYGTASGAVPPVDIDRLRAKNVVLLRPSFFGYVASQERFARRTGELFAMVEKHGIEVKVGKVYDLRDAAQAHQDLEGKRVVGKLLLKA